MNEKLSYLNMKNEDIKFRQWLESENKFMYWGFIENPDFNNARMFYQPIQIKAYNLPNSEMFTGAYDLHDNEIYDGDIVKCRICNLFTIGVVKFKKLKACFQINDRSFFLYDMIKIIGNIHQNPELVNEENKEETNA